MAKKTYINLDNLILYHNNLSAQLDKTDYVIAQALNDLNTRIEELEERVTTLEA